MPQIYKPSSIFQTDPTVHPAGTDLLEGDTFAVQNGIYAFRRKIADGTRVFANLPYASPYIYAEGLSGAEAINRATASGFQQPSQSVAVQGAVPVYMKLGSTLSLDRATQVASVVGTSGGAVTATLPATDNNYHIISRIGITLYNAAARTGGANPVTVTTSNLGSLAWTCPSAGAVGTVFEIGVEGVYRSAAAGVNTTIVCPATTSVIWRVNVIYTTAIS